MSKVYSATEEGHLRAKGETFCKGGKTITTGNAFLTEGGRGFLEKGSELKQSRAEYSKHLR